VLYYAAPKLGPWPVLTISIRRLDYAKMTVR